MKSLRLNGSDALIGSPPMLEDEEFTGDLNA